MKLAPTNFRLYPSFVTRIIDTRLSCSCYLFLQFDRSTKNENSPDDGKMNTYRRKFSTENNNVK